LASLAQAQAAGERLGADLPALRALSAQEVLARTTLLNPAVRGLTTPRVLRPIRDGWLLPEDERPVFKSGRMHPMPLMVGSNTDEGTLLTRTWPVDTLAQWQEQIQTNFGPLVDDAAARYPAQTDADARAAVAQMFADTQFNYGTRLLAQSMSRLEARTFKYLFTRRRPGHSDGPHHGEEVAHVFGNLATLSDGANASIAEWDETLSATMRKAWVAFASQGDPNTSGALRWAAYRPEPDNHLELGDTLRPGAQWRKNPLDFLDRFFDQA
jgi:para-nitrobenzyl esterase